MLEKGYLIRTDRGFRVGLDFEGATIHVDTTNPEARAYFWDKVLQNYYRYGIKTFWLDEAEPEYAVYDFDNYRYHAGPVAEVGNIYPREYARLFYEGQQENGQKDIVNLIRCAWVGSQRYGALVWSGDIMSTYEDFRKQICAGIHMGICGIPWWTTDIGGFHGGVTEDPDFRELLVRWFQFGTFCPVMRLHCCRVPAKAPMGDVGGGRCASGAENEIWSYGEANYEIMKHYIELRERMRPYTRKVMDKASAEGTPVIRPLFYNFPGDAACWDIKDQFMYGDDILVAPVTEYGQRSKRVYLPEGCDWTDASCGETVKGGQWIETDAPIEKIPVYVRAGAEVSQIFA